MLNDTIKITGVFECKVFENGKLIQEYRDENLVVNQGKSKICDILLGSGGSGILPLSRIGFGSNATAPAVGDIALTAPVFNKNIVSSSKPTATSMQFDWFLGNADHNGNTINEFGLLGADDSLFARKTGLTVVKNVTITLTGIWTITIS